MANKNGFADQVIYIFREAQRVIIGFVDSLDQTFISTVTRLAPIVAPVPAAFSVYTAMTAETIKAQWEIALITAIAIELIGMFQSKTALRSRNWNLVKNKSEPASPFGLSLAMAAIYFVTVFILALVIELAPGLSIIIYPAFVLIAASVYVSNAIATDLTRWETSREDKLRQQEAKRGLKAEIARLTDQAQSLTDLTTQLEQGQEALAELDRDLAVKGQKVADLQAELARLNSQLQERQKALARGRNEGNSPAKSRFGPDNLPAANEARQARIAQRRDRLVDLLAADPDLTNADLAEMLAVSMSTVKADKRALNGQLTGQGVAE